MCGRLGTEATQQEEEYGKGQCFHLGKFKQRYLLQCSFGVKIGFLLGNCSGLEGLMKFRRFRTAFARPFSCFLG
jgi:hypothetical protein